MTIWIYLKTYIHLYIDTQKINIYVKNIFGCGQPRSGVNNRKSPGA